MHDSGHDAPAGVTDPEGVVDAQPAGGWEDGRTADGTTAERNRDLAAGGTDVGPVEGAQPAQGTDPDLATDDQSEEE